MGFSLQVMHVLLFDIDGTLIHTGGAGGAALLTAFSHEFRVEEPDSVPFAGRTDRGIASSLFRLHHVEDSPANWHRLRAEYLRQLTTFLPQRQGRVLPGIAPLLNDLSRRDDVAVGLLTGNARDGARRKLEHYRLFHHFQFGGFGDDHVDRNDVAWAALRATREHLKQSIEADRMWVVGDTPLDVQCGRAIGARVAAVATGWHEHTDLLDAAPDLLLHDLQDARPLLDLLA